MPSDMSPSNEATADAVPPPTTHEQDKHHHIIIAGAGLTGLLLAQALRKASLDGSHVSFSIYERDRDLPATTRGWGLTINWALDTLLSLLTPQIKERLHETYVNPDATERGEVGQFKLFNLQNGKVMNSVPPNPRIRVSRPRLIKLLGEDIDVQYGKTIETVSGTGDSVTAQFTDGTTATGTLLVGADGYHSAVRKSLVGLARPPESSKATCSSDNNDLPFRLLGLTATYNGELAQSLRAIDSFFFQGTDPSTDCFMYFSFLDTPSSVRRRQQSAANNQTNGNGTHDNASGDHVCQVVMSWPFRKGWHGHPEPVEAPTTKLEQIRFMKDIARNWVSPFREAVLSALEDDPGVEVKLIKLEDWVPQRGTWANLGRATLIGDAAHTMTMYRGDGANNGIADVALLLTHILPILQATPDEATSSLKDAISAYEKEMITRARPAVLTSRRATVDAHNHAAINSDSPLVSKRVMVHD